jgi:DHA2 family multidrug resistance protein
MSIYPAAKRGTALAIWSMTTLVAPVMGPLLGGYLSDEFSWPWIFLINVPFGLFAVLVCWRALHRHETPTRKVPVDGIGLALLVVWVGALQVMLDTGKDEGWFDSTQIVLLTLVAAVGFVAFMIWRAHERHPIVDLSFFRNRNFSVGVVLMCVGYAVFFANVVILPLWLQTQLGYTASWAGLVQAPAGLTALLVSPFIGRLVQRYDARWFATVAFLVMALGLYMRSLLNAQAAFLDFVWPMLAQGIGMGFFFISVITLQLDGIPPQRIPAATGLTNFLRITAAAFSTSVATTFWDNREQLHQSRLAEATSAFDPSLQHSLSTLQGLGLSHEQAVGALTRGMVEQAYMLSSLDIFWVSTWSALLLVPLVWLAHRPRVAHGVAVAD